MSDMLRQIRAWRAKADELFAQADGLTNEAARDQMIQMGQGYEQMADRMEALAIKRTPPGGGYLPDPIRCGATEDPFSHHW